MPRAKSSRRLASWPGGAAFVGVVIPVAELGERDLEADVGLDELRDLLHAPRRSRTADIGAVGRARSARGRRP